MRKQIINILALSCALLLLNACGETGDDLTPRQAGALVVIPSVDEGTRAAVNYTAEDYFGVDGYGKVDVTIGGVTAEYGYDAANKHLAAVEEDGAFRFPADGSGLSFTIKWPSEELRTTLGATVPADQSTRDAFLTTDWLSASKSAVYTPRVFVSLLHERSKAAFVLDGAMYGRKITKLTIGGFSACCQNPAGGVDAQLIFAPDAGSTLFAAGRTGALTVENDPAMYTFTIGTAVTGFTPGSHHTIRIIAE